MVKLTAVHQFYNVEMPKNSKSRGAFFKKMEDAAAEKLRAAGGIEPFVTEIQMRDGRVSPHQAVAREE